VTEDLAIEDRWILSRLAHATETSTRGLERFRLHEVAEGLYHFFWGEICDWYLEYVKSRLAPGADAGTREAARSTLVAVLDGAFRLLHPIVPFVTAELWARLPWPEGQERPADLIIAPWPVAAADVRDEEVERQVADLQSLIIEARRLKKEYGIGEGQRVGIHLAGGPSGFVESALAHAGALEQLARVDRVETTRASGAGAHSVLPNGAEVFLPLEGIIDVERERTRMSDEIARVEGLRTAVEKRLANEKFVANAPDDIVQKERDKAAQFADQASKLRVKLDGLGS
jgi:valyl-tRNA synthetase